MLRNIKDVYWNMPFISSNDKEKLFFVSKSL